MFYSTKSLSSTLRRTETRSERTEKKIINKQVKIFDNIEIATINFAMEDNVAFIVRAAACFGCSAVNVIGSLPPRNVLKKKSGSCQDFVKINQFSNPTAFLKYSRENNIFLISAELDEDAESIHHYIFPIERKICVILGNESFGISSEILLNSHCLLKIPMPGPGFNLNTSVAGSIILYELSKQIFSLTTSLIIE